MLFAQPLIIQRQNVELMKVIFCFPAYLPLLSLTYACSVISFTSSSSFAPDVVIRRIFNYAKKVEALARLLKIDDNVYSQLSVRMFFTCFPVSRKIIYGVRETKIALEDSTERPRGAELPENFAETR